MKKNLDFKPIFIKNYKDIQKLRKQKPDLISVDILTSQIKELYLIENYQSINITEDRIFKSLKFKVYHNKYNNKYNYIYYSWINTLVKTIPKEKYLTLKTNRNQNLITEKEQEQLREFKVGVFGMSVGSNIAFILTQAGISNSITIADFDTLETTNLNRIFAGIHQIGLLKVIIAARRIYEDNPFAEVRVMSNGISYKNLENLLKKKQLNCIIEEIDDLTMKIKIRILAKKYKIPVIMITDNGDGVVLHIERYDLNYKKIFNRDFSYFEKLINKTITKETASRAIMEDIIGGVNKVDPSMLKSVKDVIDKKLVSWPQLGSAAMLGGVIGTYAIKQIFKNKVKYIHQYYNVSILDKNE